MSQTILRQRSLTNLNSSGHHSTPQLQPKKQPLIENVNNILMVQRSSKRSAVWCVINLILALLCYCKTFQSLMSSFFLWNHYLLHYVDSFFLLIFSWNLITHLYFYCLPAFHKKQLVLNEKQKLLLGINQSNEKYFTPSKNSASSTQNSSVSMKTTPVSYPSRRSSSRITPTSTINVHQKEYSPGSSMYCTGNKTPKFSPQRGSSSYKRNTPASCSQSSQYSPFADASPMNNSANYSYTNKMSPSVFLNNSQGQSPSLRLSNTSPSRAKNAEDQISDYDSLDKFIKKEEESDMRNRRGQQDAPQAFSLWTFGRAAYDFMPSISAYQLATRSPSTNRKDDDDLGTESSFKNDEMWRTLGLNPSDMQVWTEHIRKWLAQTVLEPIVQEVNKVNERLTQLGNPELHIGTISHSALQNLASTKSQHLPSLTALLPYLDVTSNQEYLVARLKELSNGGCLRLYRWNEGGQYNNKPWNTDLPSDAQIICHLFCTYMDTHLPSNPRHSEGKSFTGLHFLKNPDKPENKKCPLCIYQTRAQQNPHFKVLLEDDICDIPRGRNNFFHAVVVFLYYAKKNYHGMLERVNLGMSGINVLWVLEKM